MTCSRPRPGREWSGRSSSSRRWTWRASESGLPRAASRRSAPIHRPTRRSCESCRTRPPCCSQPDATRRSPSSARSPAVAMVGTRRASPYGTEVAYAIGRGLGASGVPVVSGLALGIDGTAHRGCLDGGGIPVAVVACGPDVVYPRRHRGLHQRVRESGLVLSELPPGTEPYRWSFPARNRIMAGLARPHAGRGGRRSERQPDHRRLREGPGPLRGGRAGPGDLERRAGNQQPAQGGRRRDHGHRRRARRVVRRRRATRADGPAAGHTTPDDPLLRAVLDAADSCASVEAIARSTGRSAAQTRAALGRLEADGYLVRRDLGGWERAAC